MREQLGGALVVEDRPGQIARLEVGVTEVVVEDSTLEAGIKHPEVGLQSRLEVPCLIEPAALPEGLLLGRPRPPPCEAEGEPQDDASPHYRRL